MTLRINTESISDFPTSAFLALAHTLLKSQMRQIPQLKLLDQRQHFLTSFPRNPLTVLVFAELLTGLFSSGEYPPNHPSPLSLFLSEPLQKQHSIVSGEVIHKRQPAVNS